MAAGRASRVSVRRCLITCCVVWFALVQCTTGISWLAVFHTGRKFWNRTSECSKRKTQGLLKPQVNICKRNLELMPVVNMATEDTILVCEDLFKNKRWNCSSLQEAPNYMADLTGGSREQAFVYALSSSSLTQSISKACALGATAKCSCGRLPNEPPPGEFKWGGCGDDVRFGSIFSRMFTDSPLLKRKNSKRSQMNIHNNLVGRKVVESALSTACKCHGVSGSCSIKTCWKALPNLQAIAQTLRRKYSTAIEVKQHNVRLRLPKKSMVDIVTQDVDDNKEDHNEIMVKNKRVKRERRLVPVIKDKRYFEDTDLIYFTKSPDYCLPDLSLGSLGTHGRECTKTEAGSGGCQSMCCGRGYTSELVQVKHRCDCKYYWCCYVKCKTCTKQVEINRCR